MSKRSKATVELVEDAPVSKTLAESKNAATGRWSFALSPTQVERHESELVLPPGFISGNFSVAEHQSRSKQENQDELVYKSAMAIATAPGKQLFMTAFMLWMSGSGLQIFSIMMIGMSLYQPLQKMFTVHETFARYKDKKVDLTLPKLVFVLCNVAGVLIVLYKCHTLGLLPTSPLDWLPTAHVKRAVEYSAGGVV